MKQRIIGALFATLIGVLAYQAEPVTATIGWFVVGLLAISLALSFRR